LNKTRFESMGAYVPERSVTTEELIGRMAKAPIFDLVALTGIKARRVRSDSEDSFTIAMEAVKNCLRNSKYEASDMDVIITTQITRFRNKQFLYEPTMSQLIKNELGIRRAMNFDLTNACAGMITGVYILDNMIKSGAVKRGMVVSGECITPIADTAIKEISEPIDEQFASLTVGDGGACVIMDESPNDEEGIDDIGLCTFAQFSDLCFGMPSIKNEGVAMYTNAVAIHNEAITRLPKLVKVMFDKNNETPDDYEFVLPHQTSQRAIGTALKKCREELEAEKLPEVLYVIEKFGNTASTSHFVVLYDKLKDKVVKKGTRVLLLTQASGLIMGHLSVKFGSMEIKP
jgi:3-oxoacyl-[acyl-carrier-protein] synthase-3